MAYVQKLCKNDVFILCKNDISQGLLLYKHNLPVNRHSSDPPNCIIPVITLIVHQVNCNSLHIKSTSIVKRSQFASMSEICWERTRGREKIRDKQLAWCNQVHQSHPALSTLWFTDATVSILKYNNLNEAFLFLNIIATLKLLIAIQLYGNKKTKRKKIVREGMGRKAKKHSTSVTRQN